MESVLKGKEPAEASSVNPLGKYSMISPSYKIGLRNDAQAHLDSNELAFLDGADGALISTGTAGNADIGVDLVLAVALRDSANRALVSTSAAGDTSISNDVSHGIPSKI